MSASVAKAPTLAFFKWELGSLSFYGASVTKVGSVTARAVWVGDVHIYSLRDAAVTGLVKSDTPKLLNALLVGVSLSTPTPRVEILMYKIPLTYSCLYVYIYACNFVYSSVA